MNFFQGFAHLFVESPGRGKTDATGDEPESAFGIGAKKQKIRLPRFAKEPAFYDGIGRGFQVVLSFSGESAPPPGKLNRFVEGGVAFGAMGRVNPGRLSQPAASFFEDGQSIGSRCKEGGRIAGAGTHLKIVILVRKKFGERHVDFF